MERVFGFCLLLVVAGAALPVSVQASGSIITGGGMSARDAYVQGKSVTFRKLVCASCPIKAGELNRERALSLKNSLEARDSANKPGTADDEHIAALCPATGAGNCADAPDEQELVHYYLVRRYRLQ